MQEWLDYLAALAAWYATETKRAIDAAGGAPHTDGVTPGPPQPPVKP